MACRARRAGHQDAEHHQDPDAARRYGRHSARPVPHPRVEDAARPCPGWTRTGCCPDAVHPDGERRSPEGHPYRPDGASAAEHPDEVPCRPHSESDAGPGCRRPVPRAAAAAEQLPGGAAGQLPPGETARALTAGPQLAGPQPVRAQPAAPGTRPGVPDQHPDVPAVRPVVGTPPAAGRAWTARNRVERASSPGPARSVPNSAARRHPAWPPGAWPALRRPSSRPTGVRSAVGRRAVQWWTKQTGRTRPCRSVS